MSTNTFRQPRKKASFWRQPAPAAFIVSVLLYLVTILVKNEAFSQNAIATILASTMLLTMATAGQTLVIITGGIDLSVGAIMSLSAIVAGEIMYGNNANIPLALLMCIAVGCCCGLLNGLGIVYGRLPPLIMTLCLGGILSRIQFALTGGTPNGTSAPLINQFMIFRLFDTIPMLVVAGAVFCLIMFYLLKRSRYGQQLFLRGNNQQAALLSGIKVKKVSILAYALCGLLSGLGGFITCAYMHHVSVNVMDSFTMMSIAAVVVGGTLLAGGKGSFIGSMIGALLLTVLTNFLVILDASDSVRNIVMGSVLILLLALYNRSSKIRQ